jgi:hypothetical protein
MAIHSCSLGAAILLDEMKAAGVKAGDTGLRRDAADWSVEYRMGIRKR